MELDHSGIVYTYMQIYTKAYARRQSRTSIIHVFGHLAASNCADLQKAGARSDGVYTIDLEIYGVDTEVDVLCDLTKDGGGWTVRTRLHSCMCVFVCVCECAFVRVCARVYARMSVYVHVRVGLGVCWYDSTLLSTLSSEEPPLVHAWLYCTTQVFMHRYDGSVEFYRNWTEYKNGFGSASGEFWLGNDNIHSLTTQSGRSTVLKIDLSVHWGSETAHSEYDGFYVVDAAKNYTLRFSSFLPTSTAGELNQEIPDSD